MEQLARFPKNRKDLTNIFGTKLDTFDTFQLTLKLFFCTFGTRCKGLFHQLLLKWRLQYNSRRRLLGGK